MDNFRLADLIDLDAVQKMADAHYQAARMPIGIIDAIDNSILVGAGWQDICVNFHRTHSKSLQRCQESDNHIKTHLTVGQACHYKCKNGLWDIGVPIVVAERHLATMFLGQFFYQEEVPDRAFFIAQAQTFGFDLVDYLAALDRVPVFNREKVDYIIEYNKALVGFITTLAETALFKRKADEALIENRMLLQSVIDCADMAIFAKDAKGRYIFSNQYHANLLQSTPDAVVGHRDVDFETMAPYASAYKANDDHVWKNDRVCEFEEAIPHPEGDRIYLACKYPLHNAQRKIFAVCGIATDITERKQVERELERRVAERTASLAASEANYRSLVENTMDIPFSLDTTGLLHYVGPQAERYGFDPNTIKGCHFLDLILPEDRKGAQDAFNRSLKEAKTSLVEFRIQRADGRVIWFEERSMLRFDDSGAIIGFTGLLRDVTARKQIEKVLKESEERYRSLFEAEPDAILVFDAQTYCFVDANPAAEKLYGYTHAEFLSRNYWDITCDPFTSKKRIQGFLAGAATEITSRWHRKKDGSTFPVEVSPCRFTLEGRTVVGAIMRDITARLAEKRQRDVHQKRLRQLAARLATAQDEEQQRIAEGLHDDVAQDLALCNLKLALANREMDPVKAGTIRDEISDLINKAVDKIRSLCFELSSSSLYQIGFKEAVEELCNSMTKRYDVCFTVKSGNPLQRLDDTTAAVLFKAIRELLFNVVKHAGTKEAIVFIDCVDNTLKIEVEDRGKGFGHLVDDQFIDMGKGLGLFGIKERLSDLNGEIHIASTPGDRTRVMLTVPLSTVFDSK